MKSVILFLTSVVIIAITSCKKDPVTVNEGTVRLIINVNHHGYPIANARVFRENGTLIFPGEDTSVYDAQYVTDANGNLTLTDIGNGHKELVLYAKGVDPSWDTLTITPVSGYQLINVTTSTGESKDVTVTIPVSE